MSYIVNLLKEKYLDKIKTTKDLIYKDKIVAVHNIQESYNELYKKNLFCKLPYLQFGEEKLFFNTKNKIIYKINNIFVKLFNKTINKDFGININNNFLVSEIYNSLWIEGVKSSKKKMKQIIKDNDQINNLKDNIIFNYYQALNYAKTTHKINEQNLFTLYNILTRNINFNEEKLDNYPYRLSEVQIGSNEIEGLNPKQIKKSIDSIFNFIEYISNEEINKNSKPIINNIFAILIIHYLFEIIHPYYDYNGRVGRILIIWCAKYFHIPNHWISFSEAINLFRDELYYDAFNKTIEKNFKFDVTYFVASTLVAMIAHKICYLVMKDMAAKIMNKNKVIINSFEKEIIINLLSKKKNTYYNGQDFILGYDEINPAIIHKSFKKLIEVNVLEVIVSKPNKYKLKWNNKIEKLMEDLSNEY